MIGRSLLTIAVAALAAPGTSYGHHRYTRSVDGSMLAAVMTLYDPENYERPVIRRRQWTRNPDAVILPYECDPDSFFRQLHEEGQMQEYVGRTYRRL